MRVGIITSEYPLYDNNGGIATFTAELARLLDRLGHDVVIFTETTGISKLPIMDSRLTIVPLIHLTEILSPRLLQLVTKPIANILNRYFPSTSKLLSLNIAALITYNTYKKHADIKLLHVPVLFAPAYLLSLIHSKTPLIVHAQGPDELLQPFNAVTFDSRLKAAIESRFMKRADVIVPCSQVINVYLKNKYNDIKQKLHFIPNFIDTASYDRRNEPLNRNSLFFFGRLEKRKGPDLVLKSFLKLANQYPKLTLTFIGKDMPLWTIGGNQHYFSDYINKLRMPQSIRQRIIQLPRIDSKSDLISYLSKHRGITILPSRYEPFGFVFVESMAAGHVTIASKQGAGSEIIQHGIDGFLVTPSVVAITLCLKEILHINIQHLKLISQRAKKKVKHQYDLSLAQENYGRLYRTITMGEH